MIERSKEWGATRRYLYDGIGVKDYPDCIVIDIKCCWANRGVWVLPLVACLAIPGSLLGVWGIFAISANEPKLAWQLNLGWLLLPLAMWLCVRRPQARIIIDDETLTYRQIYGRDTGINRRLDRDILGGLNIIQRSDVDCFGNASRQVWDVILRYGSISDAIACFRSPRQGEQLALIINEALRQRFVPASAESPEIFVYRADSYGHVFIDARVNGTGVRFVFDTGATKVILRVEDAEACGLGGKLRFSERVSTANGTMMAAPAIVNEVSIEGWVFRNVEALVARNLETSLLGQSLLKRFGSYDFRDGRLTLKLANDRVRVNDDL